MKLHLKWIGVAALAVAAFNVQQAGAQYAPYRPQQQPLPQVAGYPTSATAQPAGAPLVAPAAPVAAPATTNRYQVPAATATAYPQYPQTAAQVPAPSYPPTTYPYPQTAQAPAYPAITGYTTYPLVAQQPSPPAPPAENESMPAPTPAAPDQSVPAPAGEPAREPAAATSQPGSNSYPSTGYQTGTGYCGYGQAGCGYTDYGIAGECDTQCSGNVCFGSVSWLFMTRDNPAFRHFTAQADPAGFPYYPTSDDVVLSTRDVDHDYRSGVEIRFGSTFSTGGWADDDCYGYGNNCGCSTAPDFAWEVGYWFLDDDQNSVQVVDAIPNDTFRMYGMKNFAGLEYDGRPVNDYYDYQIPVEDPLPFVPGDNDVRLLAQRVRSSFSAQNLELNLLRLPVCGGSTCGNGYGSCNGNGANDCGPACGSPFSVTSLIGVRYIRLDDDFNYDTMWAIDDGTGTLTPPAFTPWDGSGELFYDIEVDNHLTGFQLGANMCYSVTGAWNLFWNTNFGLYNNHIRSMQRVIGEFGPATYAQSGESASVTSHKDDVAFAGEMMLGGTYDFNCHWRGILAYRALAITGVALSVDQMPEDFSNRSQVALIDSDGSIVIHGVQVGAECRY